MWKPEGVSLVMAADLTIEPWTRLAKLAPPGSDPNELQSAADRYALTADLYAAVADLWEEKAMKIDLSPDSIDASSSGPIASVTQDGISVSYQASKIEGNTQNARSAQYANMMSRARQFRAKAKPKSVLLDGRAPLDIYDPTQTTDYYDPDHIIPVID
jgi:hypothetical protein